MMKRGSTVCVVGIGAQTPLGRTVCSSVAAVNAGICAASEHPVYLDRTQEAMVVCRALWLPPDIEALERFLGLALDAALAALENAPDICRKSKVLTMIALPEPRYGLPKNLNTELSCAIEARLKGQLPSAHVELLPYGHASGLLAISRAHEMIHCGEAEWCLVGGIDSYLERETLEWLEDSRQLNSLTNRWGFIPGEGAGFCLLTSSDIAKRWNVPILAHVVASGVGSEESRINTQTVCLGKGLSVAFRHCLDATTSDALIDHIICDLNGEPYRANEFGFTMARVAGRFRTPDQFRAPADCWGDLGAASGPLFVALAIASRLRNPYRVGPLQLLSSSSEGGHRCAVLVRVVAADDHS